MGLLVKNFIDESFNQTLKELSKVNNDESYGNEASEKLELFKFNYLLSNRGILMINIANTTTSVSIQAAIIYILRRIANVGSHFSIEKMTLKPFGEGDSNSLIENIQIGLYNSRLAATIPQLYDFNQIPSKLLSQNPLIILSSISVVSSF